MDLVSVVIPTYNRASLLDRAIDSVLTQTHEHLELLVVDDGSTDHTEAVVAAYEDARLRYLPREHRGASAARNTGIRHATGRVVSFLDSDNELHPQHLAVATEALADAPPDIAGVFTGYDRYVAGSLHSRSTAPDRIITAEDLQRRNVVGGFSATTFRRRVFDEVGLLDESFPAAQDYEFYLRVTEAFGLLGIDRVLLSKHITPDSITENVERKRAAYAALRDKHDDVLHPRRIAKQHQHLGLMLAMRGETVQARRRFVASLRSYPLSPYAAYLLGVSLLGRGIFTRTATLPKQVLARLGAHLRSG